MFRPYVKAIIRLSLKAYQATILMWGYLGVCGGGFGGQDLVFIIAGGIPLNIMANMPLFYHSTLL